MAFDAELESYQRSFVFSTCMYPAMKSGWATGKTLCGLMKVFLLANMYEDNLLMVCRENYTNLLNSTIKDWERYTEMPVQVQAKKVVFPNGSQVLFSHADTVAGMVQNINLGGFLIEQAEEFETSDVWEMLVGGRLRRFLKVDGRFREKTREIWEKYPETRPKEDARAFYDYIWSHEGPHALNQGIIIANAAGRNWIWRKYKRDSAVIESREQWSWSCMPRGPRIADQCQCEVCSQPELQLWEATSFANAKNLKPSFRANHERMRVGTETEQRKFRMYVLNEDDELDLEGAYYANYMSDARKEGRIGRFLPDKSAATHTVWDLGITKDNKGGDSTAIWWFQVLGEQVRLIHYYEGASEGLQHYIRYVAKLQKRLNLHYGQHFWPHDGGKKDLTSGKERYKTARDMGLRVTLLRKEKSVPDGIERVRKMLPYCYFDESQTKRGIEALEHYQRKKNQSMSTDEKTTWIDAPLHDWASDGADAFRYLSMAKRRVGGGTMSQQDVKDMMEKYGYKYVA